MVGVLFMTLRIHFKIAMAMAKKTILALLPISRETHISGLFKVRWPVQTLGHMVLANVVNNSFKLGITFTCLKFFNDIYSTQQYQKSF